MKRRMRRHLAFLISLPACVVAIACTAEPTNQLQNNATSSASPLATASPSATNEEAASVQPVTLPVLDAFFADETFPELLKSRLQLTDEQITRLKEMARSETAKLNEANAGKSEGETTAASTAATEKISAVIGEEKTRQLAALLREQWATNEGAAEKTGAENAKTQKDFAAQAPNAVPTDSRIVVNTPAYRMDVFEDGKLVKSYKVGIGYPQFPLPTGLRTARTIIFNPSWTPPDEPWVAKMKNVSAGERVEAGSKLNPLGPIKVPIGGPSLIHGGKSPAKLGTFASHGCVGLTTSQVQDFAKLLAQLGGARLTDADIATYRRDKTQTKQIKLPNGVPVELRYETIVAEDGRLHIYRDVYDEGTNTEENLRAVLEANGVKFEDLTEQELAQALDALAQMSGKPGLAVSKDVSAKQNRLAATAPNPVITMAEKKAVTAQKIRSTKNQKEVVIEIAALKGKGYPATTDLDTGSGRTTAGVRSRR